MCHAGSPSCEITKDFDLELVPFGQGPRWEKGDRIVPINCIRVRQIKGSSNLGTVMCEKSSHLS